MNGEEEVVRGSNRDQRPAELGKVRGGEGAGDGSEPPPFSQFLTAPPSFER